MAKLQSYYCVCFKYVIAVCKDIALFSVVNLDHHLLHCLRCFN